MAVKVTAKADLSKFTASIRKLSEVSGADLKSVMVDRAGAVLSTAVKYTPKADREKIKAQTTANTKYRFDHQKQTDAGQIAKTKDDKELFRPGREAIWFLITGRRVPAKIWAQYLRVQAASVADYSKTLARRLKEALARRGLTAHTWTQIARAIGAKVKAPAYVEKAKTPAGIGTGYVATDAAQCTVTGENSSDVLIKTRTGQGIIDRAVQSQIKFMEISIRRGALNSMKARTRAFPGLFPGEG